VRNIEAIQNIFRQLAKNYTKVFRKLVPHCSVLRTSKNYNDIKSDLEASMSDDFTEIHVSFTGSDSEIIQGQDENQI